MKTLKPIFVMLMAVGLTLSLGSCSKDDTSSGSGGNNGGGSPDGVYVGTWKSTGTQIPEKLRDNVKSMELIMDEAQNYTWKWEAPDGKISTFEGVITQQKTEYKHTNGSVIWEINVQVKKLNGQPTPGGWGGIYAYADPNTLLLNVEPAVSGIYAPLASQGLGTGSSGQDAIYTFSKVQ